MNATVIRRVLNAAEHRLWHAQDTAMIAAGWQVERLGRWQRRYRHPALLGLAMAGRSEEIYFTEAAA
jgi:hypothetical protein